MISSLGPSATFEAWVAWTAPLAGPWQRIFDFGNSDSTTAGAPGNGVTYLFLTPFGGSNVVRTAITLGGGGASEDVVNGSGQLPNTATPTFVHLAVVVDDANLRMTLYVNGVPNGNVVTLRAHNILSQVKDDNNWLGRSQYQADQLFQGVYDEFRIYSKPLSAARDRRGLRQGPRRRVGAPDRRRHDDRRRRPRRPIGRAIGRAVGPVARTALSAGSESAGYRPA